MMSRKIVYSPSKVVLSREANGNAEVWSDMANKQLLLFRHKLPSSAESRAGHIVGFYLSETRLVAYDFTEGRGISQAILTPIG